MCNSIVMIFDNHKEAVQIQSALRQLRETSSLDFDAAIIHMDMEDKLCVCPMNAQSTQISLSPQALEQISSDKEFVQHVLESLPQENTALFMVMDEDDSSTALVTMLMLFAPSREPIVLPQHGGSIDGADDHFCAQVECYQAAVAKLEVLGTDSTEGDVEDSFRAVDDAYDRLVYFVSTGQDA